MSETKPEPLKRSSTIATSRATDTPGSSAARQRIPQRQPSAQNLNGSLSPPPRPGRRRSSILSYSSIDEVAQSLRDDYINPSTSRAKSSREDEEVTHWHSTPLAFALLPAIGGLLFNNGSAFVTDVLLLGLAAIFMNWSIRLPWDWYYSAQMQRRAGDIEDLPVMDDMTADDIAVESSTENISALKREVEPDFEPQDDATPTHDSGQEEAAAELRRQEKVALFSTFFFPVLAAYLIHVIRGQLSTSSTGLVSDFNLSVFLLAAEIRPCRQLVRLITDRTLHLQRTVTGLEDPFGSAIHEKSTLTTLTSRIAELEAKLLDHTIVPQNLSLAQKHDVSDLSSEMRKRYEPRLEGLERAMRRYEKRSATLALLTETRLGQIDIALKDTISLAAQAARQSENRGIVAKVMEGISAIFTLPMKITQSFVLWPMYVLEEAYAKLKAILFGSAPPKPPRRTNPARHPLVGKDEKVRGAPRKPPR